MGGNKKNKIRASSLLESVVSIAIISIVITLAMMIFFNVTKSTEKQIIDYQLINEIERIKNNIYTDKIKGSKRTLFRGYEIVLTEKKSDTEILFVRFDVFKNDKEILKKEYIIKNEVN